MEVEYSTMSSDDTSMSSNSSEESTRMEDCRIEGVHLQLPQGLCENKEIFKEFFSLSTWQEVFTEQEKQHLKNFLPTFPENDESEKEETLRKLFARENMRFGAPLNEFHTRLRNGYYRPDISKMRSLMRKAHFRDYKYQQRRYYYKLMKQILVSRQQMLEAAYNHPPSSVPKLERLAPHPPPRTSGSEQKTRRRYFQELAAVRQEVGESEHSSDDENFPEGPPPQLSKKQKKQLLALETASPNNKFITSTLSLKPSGLDLEANVTSSHNPYELNEETYRNMLFKHKKRRLIGDNHPELNTAGINLQDVSTRLQMGKRVPLPRAAVLPSPAENKVPVKRKIKQEPTNKAGSVGQHRLSINSPQISGDMSNGSDVGDSEEENISVPDHNSTIEETERLEVDMTETPVMQQPKPRNRRTPSSTSWSPRSSKSNRNITQRRIKVEPEEEIPQPVSAPPPQPPSQPPIQTSISRNTPATLSDLDGIDMMNLPVDLEEAPEIALEDLKPTPELMQETHACFFSLIRDIVCSTPEHRMSMAVLEERLKAWQENPISPLNDWYSQAPDSWVVLLGSAISFLAGDYPDAQPEDFVPYLERKPQAYQWIGAGRDSDGHLIPLCRHWFDHRDDMAARQPPEDEGATAGVEERASSPPPPRCPTTWVVRPSTLQEREQFQEQERQRYDNPHRAFTFHMHGYESVVGPVKGVYTQNMGANKPRGHSLLVAERPNFVTILALVRDATARLPNGEGTRSDICELLKDSQYLAPIQQESYLHSVVSGALDRLHYETDPCVKYDTKRKIWIYLHRARSEEEFERLHQQQQGQAKTKKTPSQRKAGQRKQKEQPKEEPAPAASPAQPRSASRQVQVATSSGIQTIQVPLRGFQFNRGTLLDDDIKLLQDLLSDDIDLPIQKNQTVEPAVKTQRQVSVVTTADKQPMQVSASNILASSIQSGKSVLAPSTVKPVTLSAPVKTAGIVPQQQTVVRQGPAIRMPLTQAASSPGPQSPQQQKIVTVSRPSPGGNTQSSPNQQAQVVRSPQPVSSPKPILNTVGGKTVMTTALTGVKLVNAMKALSSDGTQTQQTIYIKQPANQKQLQILQKQPQQQQQQTVEQIIPVTTIQQQQVLQQVKAFAQLQQQQQQQQFQLKQLQQQQVQTIATSTVQPQIQQRVVTTMSVLGAQGQPRVVTRVGGKPVALATASATTTGTAGDGTAKSQQVQVAKVFTNTHGAVISMESMLAHQKQHGTLPQGTALRVATGAKPGQASLIQIPGTAPGSMPQFAVVSQGNLLSVGQPRVLQTQIPAQSVQQQQATTAGKITANLRMVTPAGGAAGTTGINLAHIGGKPVLLASKAQQGSGTQNVLLTSQAPTVVLASQALRAPAGTLVLQQGNAQQILLPPGALNIKGLKVIPLAHAPAGKGRQQQVYARILNPTLRAAVPANILQDSTSNPTAGPSTSNG